MDKELIRNINILRVVFIILCCVLIAQLFRIQILEHDKWKNRAEATNKLEKVIPATRGSIYFSDGTSPLAYSELAYDIYVKSNIVNSKTIESNGITKEKFISDLASVFELDNEKLFNSVSRSNGYLLVIRKTSLSKVEIFSKLYPLSQDLWDYQLKYKRVYPNKTLASKIVGFVSPDENDNDTGRYGIEQYYDRVLKGSEGIFEGTKDRYSDVIVNEDFESITSKNGFDLTLTINKSIQLELEKQAAIWHDKFKAKETIIVVMEPNTGRIIAMVNYPTYDPNIYWEGEIVDCTLEFYSLLHRDCNKSEEPDQEFISPTLTPTPSSEGIIYPEGYNIPQTPSPTPTFSVTPTLTQEEKDKLLTAKEEERLKKFPNSVRQNVRKSDLPLSDIYRNSAVSVIYEPGSVVKNLTLSIAYNYNSLSTSPNFQLGGHPGYEQVLDTKLYTASRSPKKSLTVKEMLKDSDNVGAIRVAKTIPAKDFAESYERLGLGKTSGIELADEVIFRSKPANTWTRVDQATGAYGQGSVAFSPLQLTAAWNTLASNGVYYKPTIIKERNDNGDVVQINSEPVIQAISPEAAASANFTGKIATADGAVRDTLKLYQKYTFVGKTGTANIPNEFKTGYKEDALNTSFIGYLPADNPKFTMLVWFREPAVGNNNSTFVSGSNTSQLAWVSMAEFVALNMNVTPVN